MGSSSALSLPLQRSIACLEGAMTYEVGRSGSSEEKSSSILLYARDGATYPLPPSLEDPTEEDIVESSWNNKKAESDPSTKRQANQISNGSRRRWRLQTRSTGHQKQCKRPAMHAKQRKVHCINTTYVQVALVRPILL